MSRQLSISEVRRQLPALVREAGKGRPVEILNRGRVVARLLGPANDATTTADALLGILKARRRRSRKSARSTVSQHKSDHLTGRLR